MLNTPYLQGDTVLLRAVEPEDLDFLYLCDNDASVWHDGATVAPYSRALLHEYIHQYTADIYRDRQLRLVITLAQTGERIGIADLYDYEPRHNRAGVGIYIIPAMRRHHLGCDALSALCRYAFRFLHLHQLYAMTRVDNAASRALFARCGFVQIATLPQWVYGEQGYTDVAMLQRIDI